MTYTAPTLKKLNIGVGTDMQVLRAELVKVGTELTAVNTPAIAKTAIKFVDLTASMVSSNDLASNGVDLASGTPATYYGVFIAPVALTLTGMVTYTTEAYVKESTDAKIELITEAGSPVTKCSYTFPALGQVVKTMITTAPVSASMAAGQALDMTVTQSLSSSGTGHAKVFLKYTID